MMATLWACFGWVGLASCACWALALVARGLVEGRGGSAPRPSTRRCVFHWPWLFRAVAVIAAGAGLALAWRTATEIGRIEVDRSAERKAASDEKKRIHDEARRVLKQHAAKVRFAEDRADDQLDLAGIKKVDQPVVVAATLAAQEEVVTLAARVMPEPEVMTAQRWGRLNLAAASFAVALVLLTLAGDYLRAFSRNPNQAGLLLLAPRGLNALFPQADPVHAWPKEEGAQRRLLERLARRGETFVYLGAACPVKSAALSRLAWPGSAAWQLPLQRPPRERSSSAESLLAGVADGRQGLIIEGHAEAAEWLAALMTFLRARCRAQARARVVMNVVWAGDPLVLADRRVELAVLCQEANCRLFVA